MSSVRDIISRLVTDYPGGVTIRYTNEFDELGDYVCIYCDVVFNPLQPGELKHESDCPIALGRQWLAETPE